MLPWDMLVTVNGYWHYKFRNTTLDDMVLPKNEALRTLLTPPGTLWLYLTRQRQTQIKDAKHKLNWVS